MGKNTSNTDRLIRVVLGVAIAVGAWMYLASLGTLWGSVLIIVGVILVATAAMGFCPIYRILGISTCKVK